MRTPLVEKQIADQARTRGIRPEEVERKVLLEHTAIKRLLEPEDVGRYVAFLASEAAWGITGSVQTMDFGGGRQGESEGEHLAQIDPYGFLVLRGEASYRILNEPMVEREEFESHN